MIISRIRFMLIGFFLVSVMVGLVVLLNVSAKNVQADDGSRVALLTTTAGPTRTPSVGSPSPTVGMLTPMPTVVVLTPTPSDGKRCFEQTGFCIEGKIKDYWEKNNGQTLFGYPITEQRADMVEGKPLQLQWFERNRLELHPENVAPYDVLLGRLGDDRLVQQGRSWPSFGKVSNAPANCEYFADTGHSLCEPFLKLFRANGLEFEGEAGTKSLGESLALFGKPLGEPQMETNGSGDTVMTQWFERARFEHHPKNAAPYDVLLGLLGAEITTNVTKPMPTPTAGPQPTATAMPTVAPPTATAMPEPSACDKVPGAKDARIEPGKCFKFGQVYTIDIFGFAPNEEIGYWVTAPTGLILGTVKTRNIGPDGGATLVVDTNGLIPIPGQWYWVFEGTTSHHQSIVYFLMEN